MKKREKGFHFSNKLTYTLIAILVLVFAGVGVHALYGTDPYTMGHTISEVAPPQYCGASNDGWLKYSNGVWQCVNAPSGSGGGITGYEVVNDEYTVSVSVASVGEVIARTVSCPSGKKILGGGCRLRIGTSTSSNQYYSNTFDYPVGDSQWQCAYVAHSSSGSTSFTKILYTYAICADAS